MPRLHWIVVEDSPNMTSLVTRMLERSKVSYTHLHAVTPDTPTMANMWGLHSSRARNPNYVQDLSPFFQEMFNKSIESKRGLAQRNAGLAWIRNHTSPGQPGAVYFADDDNTYDIRLFELMRFTKNISVWPVGLISGGEYSNIDVRDNKVVGWHVLWGKKRPFAIDMAGFSVSLRLIHEYPHANFYYSFHVGWLEPEFLKQFKQELSDLEPVAHAHNYTEVLVWHTKTAMPNATHRNRPGGPVLEV